MQLPIKKIKSNTKRNYLLNSPYYNQFESTKICFKWKKNFFFLLSGHLKNYSKNMSHLERKVTSRRAVVQFWFFLLIYSVTTNESHNHSGPQFHHL